MDVIWQVLIAAGVPSAVVGIGVWRVKRYFEKRESKREEAEQRRKRHEVLTIQGVNAAIALAEVTAKAVRDGKCNGEMKCALDYAQTVKHAQKDFLVEMGVNNLFDEG